MAPQGNFSQVLTAEHKQSTTAVSAKTSQDILDSDGKVALFLLRIHVAFVSFSIFSSSYFGTIIFRAVKINL